MHQMFGVKVDVSEILTEIFDRMSKCSSVEAQLALRDIYETNFGIFNHSLYHRDRPLALIAMHAKENTSENSLLYDRLDLFARLNIREVFGLSVTEFLDQPTDICEMQIRIATQKLQEKGKEIDEVSNALKDAGIQAKR